MQVPLVPLVPVFWLLATVADGKGGGGSGSSGGGSFAGRTGMVGPATYATPGAFAAVVLVSSGARRRYGRGYNATTPEACTMATQEQIQDACGNLMSQEEQCWDCVACETEDCVGSIGRCDEFLAEMFPQCEEPLDVLGLAVQYAVFAALAGCVIYICYRGWKQCDCSKGGCDDSFLSHRQQRLESPSNRGELPASLALKGWAEAEDEGSVPCTYDLTVDDEGKLSGSRMRANASSFVTGYVNMFSQVTGDIRWHERGDTEMEVSGIIHINDQGVSVAATWVREDQVGGELQLHCGVTVVGQAVGAADIPQAVVLGTVVRDVELSPDLRTRA
ncbi:unnamed protein product [Effrenium voratum]|uniref:Uncharacterized protein n=1 Tax=Effrenium voratum TaxID=2562239 RepID=A0AA36I5J3_9DINO|nr:unnamed protein product [Effrenium voratum]CAJ1438192.1 unnamed protein product [Effrenium voratum]